MILLGCAHRETTLRRWIVQGWLDALDHGGLEHCFQIVTPMVVGEAWLSKNEHNRDAMLRAFVRRNDRAGLRHLMVDSTLPGGDLTAAHLASLTQPTLVARGADDLVVPRWINEELVAALPDARYAECPGVGHSVAIEDPDWFTERLLEFLGD
jgi:pimeloyl-ACP methyl ester carboxylesterase